MSRESVPHGADRGTSVPRTTEREALGRLTAASVGGHDKLAGVPATLHVAMGIDDFTKPIHVGDRHDRGPRGDGVEEVLKDHAR
jgi:hypothetical protein